MARASADASLPTALAVSELAQARPRERALDHQRDGGRKLDGEPARGQRVYRERGATSRLQQFIGDVAAAVTFPYRYLRLAAVTREVADDAKEKFKNSKSKSDDSVRGAANILKAFLPTYTRSHVIARTTAEDYRRLLNTSLDLLITAIQAEDRFQFEPYHKAIRGPGVDHYKWGNEFFRSMVKYRNVRVSGVEHVVQIKEQLSLGDNVILLANHQTEADPQVLSLLLEQEGHGDFAERCIFVAGHKVTTDPLAIPFSMGRNLLTIYSKKYLSTFDEEERAVKSERNRLTVLEMQRLLNEGGHAFWVAPSGGRDRRSLTSGEFEPSKFDEQSVGLFYLLAQKAAKASNRTTHFYPLAMWSHRLVPPPEDAKANVGESRSAARAPVGMEFGSELDPEALGGRKKFPLAAERAVQEHYARLDANMKR